MRQRVQKLVESGVMQIVAVTDPMQTGFARQAMVSIGVTATSSRSRRSSRKIPEVDYIVITAGSWDILAEVVVEDDAHLLRLVNGEIRAIDGVTRTESFLYLKLVKQTYNWGADIDHHTARHQIPRTPTRRTLSDMAREHLWMHFTKQSSYADAAVPTIVRGDGARIFDVHGKSLSGRLVRAVRRAGGARRRELAEAAFKQANELAFFPLWSYAHPQAIELADRLADLAPATSTRSSSPPAAARRSRPRGSWPSST